MDLLENTIRDYAWGSRTAIAGLLGRPPSKTPQAELWLGAHPQAPSRVSRSGVSKSLLEVIEEAPARELGPKVHARFGAKLPFLLKVLAAETPLSLQAHPSLEQAKEGFAREDALGIARDASHRNYRDANHKPELICALTPFDALCGFRRAEHTRQLFEELAVDLLAPAVDALGRQHGRAGTRAAFEWLMTLDAERKRPLVDAVVRALERPGASSFAAERRWALELARLYPGDMGIVSALMLNLVQLSPGQAIFLPAGNLHAYLQGTGVEIMANSDNVLRGGLTPKHVDVPELLSVLDFTDGPVPVIEPPASSPGEVRYAPPVAEFALSRLAVSPQRPWQLVARGPEVLLCVEGAVCAGGLDLDRGASAFVPASDGAYELRGEGVLFRATCG